MKSAAIDIVAKFDVNLLIPSQNPCTMHGQGYEHHSVWWEGRCVYGRRSVTETKEKNFAASPSPAMALLSPARPPAAPPLRRWPSAVRRLRTSIVARSSLPFPPEKAKHYRELEAAVEAVERACRLCVDVKKSLLSREGRVLEKNDRTPVTVADFGVQALISLELNRLFPSIPLVAEEDSSFLRSSFSSSQGDEDHSCDSLVGSVLNAVSGNASCGGKSFTYDIVLGAIDRGGKNAVAFGVEPATYWVLDPIDGTRGFLRGNDFLYVVGLALIVEGEIVAGIMGCPNWKNDPLAGNSYSCESANTTIEASEHGTIMIAHVGCGTWSRKFSDSSGNDAQIYGSWKTCSVDSCSMVHEARFCIPDSQTWESLPLSCLYSQTVDDASVRDEHQIILLPTCCGSLCKYLMVASGRASIFLLRAKVQPTIKAWDHAVGMICVQEAGGKVTDWKGNQLNLAADQVARRIIFPSGGVLVSNGNIHTEIINLISSSSSVK
ncbi:hypothetical protein Taro_036143 [Colocasia esculenta]|uniref:PAP-specific phosphatase, mitochondrial n=1 Tax=Colocasia esculenta TaxID=4460 RepID=A0A843W0T1_COLES|nr:hypothetical protein [Colocasia esculenta]